MTNPIKLFLISVIFSSLYFTKIYAQKEDKSLLYEISGNGLTQPSYLYGTIHIICKDDFVMTEATKKKFSETQQVYLEIDMDDPKMMPEMMKSMYMTDGSTIKSLLSETDYQKVSQFFKDTLKMNIGGMDKMKPFVLSSMSIPKMLSCPTQSYEETFMKMAKTENKEILGLETVQDQFNVLDKMGMKKQADMMLVKMVNDWNEGKETIRNMINDYKQQDVELLLEDMSKSKSSDKDFQKDLLDTRNNNWIPVITKVVAEKPTFFAVGAGHLGGEKGVISLLKKQGFTVKAVK
ncbi:MAG: TraB/GumN family protein [Arcicella sp.]|nr:TraB/GumN family protein [Arcicella sp.]